MATFGSKPSSPTIRIWLAAIWFMVLAMVGIGGITRLTGSGLSIVDWRPITGALPPMNESEWSAVFALYRETPQFSAINSWMTLNDFKGIFFWEYFHRLLGRLIGFVVFIPWVIFLLQKKLRKDLALKTLGVFGLGGLQGVLGWYMVKSGLVNVPEVSHFRLAAHLSLAFLVGQLVLWIWLGERPHLKPLRRGKIPHKALLLSFSAVLVFQIIYGAFMAGTRAGWLASDYPTMNGEWIPSALFIWTGKGSAWLHSPLLIHFLHRTLGVLTGVLGVALAWRAFRHSTRSVRIAAAHVGAGVFLQFLLGVFTVVFHVPTWIAVAHQCGAYLLLSATVWLVFELGRQPAEN